MNRRVFGFPGRYIQGPGALAALPALLSDLGVARPGLVVDPFLAETLGRQLLADLAATGIVADMAVFGGECTKAEIGRVGALFTGGVDGIVVAGGGKAIDTAKGVARAGGLRLVVAPTIASNDSPTSRLIVLYDENHRILGVERLARNPDAVVVDTALIAGAPVRFFRAGIGDALSKAFEVKACVEAGGTNFFDSRSPCTALLLAEACLATLHSDGEAAVAAVLRGTPDEAVEAVVEATVLMSGLAFESGGLSIAHALTRGFSAEPAYHDALHGEVVGFGTVVQLAADPATAGRAVDIARFARRLGLPVTLADLGGDAGDAEALLRIGALTCAAPYIGNFPVRLDPSAVATAIRAADAIGRALAA
ncbi:MAG TPA: glycerol dehydrogenase [Rhizobiales bacterium]|nr:glycerol dehydrogenase [Hyphomicrobiales bacterium]